MLANPVTLLSSKRAVLSLQLCTLKSPVVCTLEIVRCLSRLASRRIIGVKNWFVIQGPIPVRHAIF